MRSPGINRVPLSASDLREQRLVIPGILSLRVHPVLDRGTVDSIIQTSKRTIDDLCINPYSTDLSPFCNNHWAGPLNEQTEKTFSNLFGYKTKIDYSFSTSTALQEALLQLVEIHGPEAKIYIDLLPDGWEMRQIKNLSSQIANVTDHIEEADIVILTHGTPELGLSSLEGINLERFKPHASLIIDAASDWPTLSTPKWKEILQTITRSHECVVIGDLQKVIGTGMTYGDAVIPNNLAFMIYTENLFEERLRTCASISKLPKDLAQEIHWTRISTRRVINGIPTMNIVYGHAFLQNLGSSLSALSTSALDVSSNIRSSIQGIGELCTIAHQISEKKLQDNTPQQIIQLEDADFSISVQKVLPIVKYQEQIYGFVRVFPMLGIHGQEILERIYSLITKTFFEETQS